MANILKQLRNIFIIILMMLTVCFASETCAQEHLSRSMLMLSNVNTAQGLSSDRVYSIVQADDGAMWISTKRGVDRYNGRIVTGYQLSTDKIFSDASGGRNIKLLKDEHQQIYAYDNKGKLYVYNRQKDAFDLIYDLFLIFRESVWVNEIIIDKNGTFWIAMNKGVYIIPSQGHKKFIVKNTYVNHIAFVGNLLLIGSTQGIFSYSIPKKRLRRTLADCSVLSSYHDVANHQLWLGTFHKGIQVVDDRTWQPIAMPTSLKILPNHGGTLGGHGLSTFASWVRWLILVGITTRSGCSANTTMRRLTSL